ncbi:precorrin-6A/cobalt-precorrin-6A reductase [Streptomyces edwardsiae]|uniref:precorrin-6A/cobalt-precorrin-6A reductase n=1 Tax=Streptomyces edwardsiae TaxID=3075527 RepID=UPI003872E465
MPRGPGALAGEVRVGGFGGAEGLADWLGAQRVDAVVDATHAFAAAITANAARAAAVTGLPLVVLRRPTYRRPRTGWTSSAGHDPAGGRARPGAAAQLSSGRLRSR